MATKDKIVNLEDLKVLSDHVEGEVTDLKSDLNEQQIKDFDNFARESNYYNLIWTENKYIKQNGDVGNLSGVYATLDYYPVHQGDILHIRVAAPGQSDVCVFYNAQKQFVSYFTISSSNTNYLFTAPSDGFIRLSNEPSYVPNENAFMLLTNPAHLAMDDVENDLNEKKILIDGAGETIKNNIHYYFDLDWADGKYINRYDGEVYTDSNFAYTGYYRVYAGQIMQIYLSGAGANECCVAFYDNNKTYTGQHSATHGRIFITAQVDGYARFATRKTLIPTSAAYVRNIVDTNLRTVFFESVNGDNAAQVGMQYESLVHADALKYTGDVTPTKRFLAIGFDDFRNSDFSAIIPMLKMHRAHATFNKVATGGKPTSEEIRKIKTTTETGNEVGDHTLLHYAFPYVDALFNGQNPSSPDGNQTPYPTNDMMRTDAGDGKNAFGKLLTDAVSLRGCDITSAWGNLTDSECQTIRETYSVLKNPVFAPLIDRLSETYLGTTGSSNGSFNTSTGKYEHGVFTGCSTSNNHEVWSRIVRITLMYYKDVFGLDFDFKCWSMPGEKYFGMGLQYDGASYYDTAHEKLYNMNARFTESLTGESVSFAEILGAFGYEYTHDFVYPSRYDNGHTHRINRQFIINANLSRNNAIVYPTNRYISYGDVATQYPESFFSGNTPKGQQMYEAETSYYTFLNYLRANTANGIIGSEVVDSENTYSEKVFFDELLKFCKKNDIEVITKSQAYDICFNHQVMNGNLMYNPRFENSIKNAYPNASNIPTNPDGFFGPCTTSTETDGTPVLEMTGGTSQDAYYLHLGIPTGKIKLQFSAKTSTASQYVIVYKVQNNSRELFQDQNDDILGVVYPSSNGDWNSYEKEILIADNPIGNFDQLYSGYGDKICGIYIRFSWSLKIKDISITKEE